MAHIRPVTRLPRTAQQGGNTDPVESVILLLLSVFFSDWDNYPQVIQNLRKFYAKTP